MTRFGDSANGPSVLDISNISGVSNDIATLAGYTTELSNLGPVSAEMGRLGTTAAVADLALLASQATVDDLDALADVTSELALLGTSAMADASTGHIQALASSTVGATSQLSIDALGQITSEISLLANNISTVQNAAANLPLDIEDLADVNFQGITPSAGQTLSYNATASSFELASLPTSAEVTGTAIAMAVVFG